MPEPETLAATARAGIRFCAVTGVIVTEFFRTYRLPARRGPGLAE
jgi:hypothetical protein